MKTVNGYGSDAAAITVEQTATLCQAVRAGAAFEASARFAGIQRDTFWWWMRQGRKPDGERVYKDFVARVDEAFAEFQVTCTLAIQGAFDPEKKTYDWRAPAWMLERRVPKEYGKTMTVDGTVKHEHAIVIDPERLAVLSDEKLEAFYELIRELRPAVVEGEIVAEVDSGSQ